MFQGLTRFIDGQRWLDTIGDPLQSTVGSVFKGPAGKQAKNFLNGVWLGHPLHPMLTDVPIGAWTCTLLLDGIGSAREDTGLQTAADLTLATGLASGLASAATGLTDWSDTYGKERKVGLLHGLLMVSSVVAYTASLVARLTGARSKGIALSTVGYALAASGAYLGGDEVYDIGYGVNHTAFQHGPGEYVEVMAEEVLPADTLTKAKVKDVSILLVKQGSSIYCLDDTCVHAGCSLAGGTLEGHTVICPCHGSQFDLRDGSVINGPATMPEPHYDVRVRQGVIEVKQAG